MRSALIDSAVALHADGSAHPLRDPCRQIIRAAGEGSFDGHASVELIQEYVHVTRRNGKPLDTIEPRVDLLRRTLRLHPFTEELLPPMLRMLKKHAQLETRDAIHLATAVNVGVELVVSPDHHFDGIAEIGRVDPRDASAVAALTGSRGRS